MSDLRESHRRGMISRVPCYNSIFNYLEDEGLTLYCLNSFGKAACRWPAWKLILLSILPASEHPDITAGMTTNTARCMQKAHWVKAHVMCGVKTNIITAVEIGHEYSGDSPYLPPLLNTTAKAFTISEVSADAAYGGADNVAAIAAHNGTPFMAFKRNSTGTGYPPCIEQMFHYFKYKREEYLQHYHKRSNVESTFSMMKRKFGDSPAEQDRYRSGQ